MGKKEFHPSLMGLYIVTTILYIIKMVYIVTTILYIIIIWCIIKTILYIVELY